MCIRPQSDQTLGHNIYHHKAMSNGYTPHPYVPSKSNTYREQDSSLKYACSFPHVGYHNSQVSLSVDRYLWLRLFHIFNNFIDTFSCNHGNASLSTCKASRLYNQFHISSLHQFRFVGQTNYPINSLYHAFPLFQPLLKTENV